MGLDNEGTKEDFQLEPDAQSSAPELRRFALAIPIGRAILRGFRQ